VLSLSRKEREMLGLLLQTAARSSAGDKRVAYSDLLRRTRSTGGRGATNGQTYLQMTADEVLMVQELVAPDPETPKQTASIIKRLGAKVERLAGRAR
jgi:hypothetical protein